MDITLSLVGEIPVFRLCGRLDASTSSLLEERLRLLTSDRSNRVVIDCAELSYVSSAGLRVFLSLLRNLSSVGGGVAFASLSDPVQQLFHLAGLEEFFIIAPSPELAAARLA
jgi:anti-anti-sigma factor